GVGPPAHPRACERVHLAKPRGAVGAGHRRLGHPGLHARVRLRPRVPDDRPARRGRGQPGPPLVAAGAMRASSVALAAAWLTAGPASAVAQAPAPTGPAAPARCITPEDCARATAGELPTDWT